jgi:hypothetical protein
MKTKLATLGFALVLSALVFSGCGQSSAEPAQLPAGPRSVSNLLADPVYDNDVRIHGEVSLLGELLCPCFELTSGGETVHVWYGLMVEDDGTERPAVSVEGIENGDTVVVTGELKTAGLHTSLNDFWASSIEPSTAAGDEYCLDSDTDAKLSYQEAVQIARGSECLDEGKLKETRICNENTGTWWIDLDIDKPGCAPACVVDVSDRTAEINWRCTGAVPPTSVANAPSQYEVTVRFNTSVTQDDLSESEEVLRAYDDGIDYVIMESWPPVGRALLATDAPDFCRTVEAQLERNTYIDGVTCELWDDVGEVDPDAPVSSSRD